MLNHRVIWRQVAQMGVVFVGLLSGFVIHAEERRDPWAILPASEVGAVAFREAHPTFDGRGVVIAILDTGVDGYAPGMTETSEGMTKIIEVRNFTEEGCLNLDQVTFEDGCWSHEEGLKLRGADQLSVPPIADNPMEYPVFMAIVKEAHYQNVDGLDDFNDDGDVHDQFGVLVYLADRQVVDEKLGAGKGLSFFKALNDTAAKSVAREQDASKIWVIVPDTNGDNRLDDETPIREYHVNFDQFTPGNPQAPESRTLMAWSVNIREDKDFLGTLEPKLEFHYDSGSHGSHCAGIAAGFEVSGQKGLHGVAPGAWVMSLKLGDNRLSGGATTTETMKKAYEFAASFGERYGIPVVVNMSFGVGSVEEEDDRMGRFLDDLMAEHPHFYVCTSAGNEGPGISTVGLPATSQSIISTGAFLSRQTGRDLYQADLPKDVLFYFSSRGGEAAKPDVVAPGSALSTVPGHVDGSARYNGTSMASPQTAGAVACLLSAAQQEGLKVHWGLMKRALIAGAVPMSDRLLIEQGGGLVNISHSWDILKQLAQSVDAHHVLDFHVQTRCPNQQDGMAPAAYWRVPGFVPSFQNPVRFEVKPVFHPDLSPDDKDTLFRAFTFKSDAPWIDVMADKRYVRGDMTMSVDVRYRADQLQKPGIYCGRVVATRDGGDLKGLSAREFYLWNTVVVGADADITEDAHLSFVRKGLKPGEVQRHYVNVPPGASMMRVMLDASERLGAKTGSQAFIEINDPEGAVVGEGPRFASPDDVPVIQLRVPQKQLRPGTYEINVVPLRSSLGDLAYELSVTFDGYAASPCTITEVQRPGSDGNASATVTVSRVYPGRFQGTAQARVQGFKEARTVKLEKTDVWSLPFTLNHNTPRAEFHLCMDERTANLFTDCAVNIMDASGKVVTGTGFSGLSVTLDASLPEGADEASYSLEVKGGFAVAADMKAWAFDLDARYFLGSPLIGSVESQAPGALTLFSGYPVELSVTFSQGLPAAPAGMSVFGDVRFFDGEAGDAQGRGQDQPLVFEIPIDVK